MKMGYSGRGYEKLEVGLAYVENTAKNAKGPSSPRANFSWNSKRSGTPGTFSIGTTPIIKNNAWRTWPLGGLGGFTSSETWNCQFLITYA
ncbi:hypothetical protein RCIA104 [Methanocella arvoryzae MRE50]|uniref:Uncharacterized protein n=1 Tax=Methanocella arvoryzae (strain DSM 22066 / NBRC 105507 / MRE50) TaxID=351160 RepID=Q0W4K6_METAR|nr:hypothetical protein RCIA104 [Methanocella arvoryzae MRE50]